MLFELLLGVGAVGGERRVRHLGHGTRSDEVGRGLRPARQAAADDYEPDAPICARIVGDGLVAGARRFIADIEAPSERMDTPAYEYFGLLGFTRLYVRTHWTVV